MDTQQHAPVVFGLIGAGGIAQSQHLPNLTRAHGIRLKTVCDLKPDLLAAAQSRYAVPHVTQNHRQLLADPQIQAVVIATRADTHVSLVTEALEAGKHVYVEKPLADTVEECARITEARRRSGRLLAVGFNRRMAPACQLLRQILQAHGGAHNIHCRISDAYWIWGRDLEPGTRVIHEVCHTFDLLRYLVGSEVRTIYCAASRPDDETIALQFTSGCVASITASGYTTYDLPKESVEVVVDRGAAIMTDFAEVQTFGLRDFDRTYRFAGHAHPDRDMTHRYLLEQSGAQAMLDLRRIYWEACTRLDDLRQAGDASSPEARELEQYLSRHAPVVNYMGNKGWIESLEHFAHCIATSATCCLASAEDGLAAAMLAHAAIRSRTSGQVVAIER